MDVWIWVDLCELVGFANLARVGSRQNVGEEREKAQSGPANTRPRVNERNAGKDCGPVISYSSNRQTLSCRRTDFLSHPHASVVRTEERAWMGFVR